MRTLGLALLVTACGAMIAPAADKPEPRFRGKPLDHWIERMRAAETQVELDEAVTAVEAFGKDALPRLRIFEAMLDDRSDPFRRAAGTILASFGADAAPILPDLLKDLKEGTSRDPAVALRVIGAMGPAGKDAVPVLTAMLKDKEQRDRRHDLIQALAHIGPEAKAALSVIVATIRVQREAARNDDAFSFFLRDLGRMGEAAVPTLTTFLDDKGEAYRRQALEELAHVGPAAKPALEKMKALQKDTVPAVVRLEAAKAVWAVGRDESALATLKELLTKVNVRDRTRGRGGFDDSQDSLAYKAAVAAVALGADAKPLLPDLKAFAEAVGIREESALGDEIRALETGIPVRRRTRTGDSYPRRTPASTGTAAIPGRGGRGE